MSMKRIVNFVGLVLLAAVLCLWGQHTRPGRHQETTSTSQAAEQLATPEIQLSELHFNLKPSASAQYAGPTKAQILEQVSRLLDYNQFRRELENLDLPPDGLRNHDYIAQQLWIAAVQTYSDRFEQRLREGVATSVLEAWVDRSEDFTLLEYNLISRYQELLRLYGSQDMRRVYELKPSPRGRNQTDPPVDV